MFKIILLATNAVKTPKYWKVAPQKIRIYGKANAQIIDFSLRILEEILVSVIQATSAPL